MVYKVGLPPSPEVLYIWNKKKNTERRERVVYCDTREGLEVSILGYRCMAMRNMRVGIHQSLSNHFITPKVEGKLCQGITMDEIIASNEVEKETEH